MSTAADSHRLALLSAAEIEALYGFPNFSDEDRQAYFELSEQELAVVEARYRSVGLFFALELGYFKAKQRFFDFTLEQAQQDLRFLAARYFPDFSLKSFKLPSRPTRTGLQQDILKLTGYRLCDAQGMKDLEARAERLATRSTQPQYVLRELMQHLANENMVLPVYTALQDLIGRVLSRERQRVVSRLDESLPRRVKTQLMELLATGDDDSLYQITALKKEARDFSRRELKQEVQRRQVFKPLHDFATQFLVQAGLSNESSRYYASLVRFYTVYKLRRQPQGTSRLYLLCFAHQRFREINDNLIEAFMHLVSTYKKEAKTAAEDAMRQAQVDAAKNLGAAGQVLRLFIDPATRAETPFSKVQAKAFKLLEREQFPTVADYLLNIDFDRTAYQWAQYTKLSSRFKINLRHLFCELEFGVRVDNAPLLKAVDFLQRVLREGKSPQQIPPQDFPQRFIAQVHRPYLYQDAENLRGKARAKRLIVDRYEFLVYRELCDALQAGNVFVRHSNEYKRFEDDLISDERWAAKDQILKDIAAPLLTTPIETTLTTLRQALVDRFDEVNQRIIDSTNEHIRVRGKGENRRWTLAYPTSDEPVNSPFYTQLPGIDIADLLWFVAGRTQFLSKFTHVLERYVKQPPDPRLILASLVAMGTNMGLGKMAEVSGLGLAPLQSASRNFLRLETLKAANDAISNATAQLPAFKLYNIQDKLHSSSDGQRFETQINTFNARYSPKYFGLKKGVSACTLVANHVPINARIIGTQEHESHYVFDLLYNNTSDIKPERHSTDTHGTNQVNFWILQVFGHGFAPRYKNLRKKTETLVGPESPSHYADKLIQPQRKFNEKLIVAEWPNIQRIMASLADKDVSQATIVRKLSSYALQNQTKKALWELDDIYRTLYVLDFIDHADLRQAVQKALNRGEAYHRFRKAVAFVNTGAFRVKTEAEQALWNECSRLIANAVIFYNTALLSKIYEQKLAAGDDAAIQILRGISPVAWQHINLFGSFEFSETPATVDLDGLAALYERADYWQQAMAGDDAAPDVG